MPMLLNMSKFMENGGIESGYILKPTWMRSEGKKKLTDFTSVQLSFTLKILVGYNLRQSDVLLLHILSKRLRSFHRSELQ